MQTGSTNADGVNAAPLTIVWLPIHPAPFSLLERRDIDFDPELDVRLGEIPLRQQRVKIGRQKSCPGIEQPLPMPPRAERWGKMILHTD